MDMTEHISKIRVSFTVNRNHHTESIMQTCTWHSPRNLRAQKLSWRLQLQRN